MPDRRPASVTLSTPQCELKLKNDFVLALTGYHPDFALLRKLGIELTANECRPVSNPETLESNVPGMYLAGVIIAGMRTGEIFIENGRFHGRQIAADLVRKLSPKRQSKAPRIELPRHSHAAPTVARQSLAFLRAAS